MSNVIIYWPWGAGGNLVRNIISLDTRFEFFDDRVYKVSYPDVDSRYAFLHNYYSQPVQSNTWLTREWSIRTKIFNRYNGEHENITYWNPDELVAYGIHGTDKEIENVKSRGELLHYDRVKVNKGLIEEQPSPWKLIDCRHIFLIPRDVGKITEIYNSKNPTINQLEHEGDLEHRRREAKIINTTMTNRLSSFKEYLDMENKWTRLYWADQLYAPNGYGVLFNISNDLGLNIPINYIKTLHHIWLQSTKNIYYNYFNRELA